MPATVTPSVIPVSGAAAVRPLDTGDAFRWYGSSSGYFGIVPPATPDSTTYVWPSTDGAGSLTSDGAGNLSWAAAGLTIGDAISDGTAEQILFEDSSNQLASSSEFKFDGSLFMLGVTQQIHSGGSLMIQEKASAVADSAGYGQLWVKTATPNQLWFTDDAGTDTQLGVGGSPGGADTQIQFNNSGAFGGSANLTWNGTTLSAGGFTNASGGANSEAFGAGAVATGAQGSAFGWGAQASNTNTSSFGGGSWAKQSWTLALGYASLANADSAIAIGALADASGANSIAIGRGTSNLQAESVVIGRNATATAANQFVAGAASYEFNDVYFGQGVTNATPTAYTIHGTGGSGTDIAGADIQIAGGIGTGTGASGSVKIQTAVPGGTSSTPNTLSDAAEFDDSTTAGDTRFLLYDVDNGILERVTVGAADSGGAGFKVLRIPN